MKKTNHPYIWSGLRCLTVVLAASLLTSYVSMAVPYAAQVVKSGNTVNFVLNQNAQGITVLLDGSVPLTPSVTTNAGAKTFDMTGYSSFQIIVTGNTARAWTQFIADGTDRNFYLPRGVAINKNPGSPNFGKVYVGESYAGPTGAGRTTANGVYVLNANGVADGGVKTGGVDWNTDTNKASAPYRSVIGPDNHLYVADLFNDRAYEFNDDLSVATEVIDASNKSSGQYRE